MYHPMLPGYAPVNPLVPVPSYYAAAPFATPSTEPDSKRHRSDGRHTTTYKASHSSSYANQRLNYPQSNSLRTSQQYIPPTPYPQHARPQLLPAQYLSPVRHAAPGSYAPPHNTHLRPGPPPPQQLPPSIPSTISPVPPPPPEEPPFFAKLHNDIISFVREVTLTPSEIQQRRDVIQAIRHTLETQLYYSYPHAELQIFGSFASGLSLHSSDLDLVITGITQPDPAVGFYEPSERREVANHLSQISRALSSHPHLQGSKQFIIRGARIPIIKLKTSTGLAVDISIGGSYGINAARFVHQQIASWPQLRPLVVTIKALLHERSLNDTATGGLGSYSLTNMVLAHLQMEKKKGPLSGLGTLLLRFFQRFGGGDFQYDRDAVAVGKGGIVPQHSLGLHIENYGLRLVLQCPLTGREVAGGSYRMDMVIDTFNRTAKSIEQGSQRAGDARSSGTHSAGTSGATRSSSGDRTGAGTGATGLLGASVDLVNMVVLDRQLAVTRAGKELTPSRPQLGKRSRDGG